MCGCVVGYRDAQRKMWRLFEETYERIPFEKNLLCQCHPPSVRSITARAHSINDLGNRMNLALKDMHLMY